MDINVRRCYYHRIAPLVSNKGIKNILEERIKRLSCMLEYGYLVPGYMLEDILKEEYKNDRNLSFGNDKCVYLAEHIQSELAPVGLSYKNWTFSAFLDVIIFSPSIVFDEHIVENKKISKEMPAQSEEIRIEEKIPLQEMIALALPYETPIKYIKDFLLNDEEEKKSTYFSNETREEQKALAQYLSKLLKNKREIVEKGYEEVRMFEEVLEKHKKNIPCIRYDGTRYDIKKEYEFIDEKEEKVLKLINEMKDF